MKKLLYLGLLSVCVLLGSCVEKNVFNAFDKVERYMDVYSDSALLLLEQIPHPEKLRGKQRADYDKSCGEKPHDEDFCVCRLDEPAMEASPSG